MRVTLDGYVLDVLMRDLTEHEKRPSAFLVYLYVWRHSRGAGQRNVALSLAQFAEGTGLSKSAVQGAIRLLRRRRLLASTRKNTTAVPVYRVERPWIRR